MIEHAEQMVAHATSAPEMLLPGLLACLVAWLIFRDPRLNRRR